MKQVSFDVSREDMVLIGTIVSRANEMGLARMVRISLMADLCAAKAQGCDIDFSRLLGFDDFSFTHDITGIISCMDRTTGLLTNCFVPRSRRSEDL